MFEKGENKAMQDDEIDLMELAKTIWTKRTFIFKITFVFTALGIIVAFTTPEEFRASSKLLPEIQEKKMSGLGGLAGIAGLTGVDLSGMSGGSSGVLTPELYPEIAKSLPLVLSILTDTVFFEKRNIRTTPIYFFKNLQKPSPFGYLLKYTIGIPGVLRNKEVLKETEFNQEDSLYYRISREDWDIIQSFRDRIMVETDSETGIIELSVEMPDPYAAAQVAKKIELMITEAVTKYKTDKTIEKLRFIQKNYEVAKSEFERLQLLLALASDRNKNITTETAQIKLKKIGHEYDVAFEVYKGLSSQVEQAKIQLKEETPVFSILEPVRIPERQIKPKRPLVSIIFCVLGAVLGSLVVVTRFVFRSKLS